MVQKKNNRRNLVILRAGNNSLHPGWIAEGNREFDLFVSYYGDQSGLHSETADFYEARKGPKWSCIADLLKEYPDLIGRYDVFWFPDDDLEATTDTVNRMFAFFHAFQLALAQPALTRDSYYTWENLLQDKTHILRFTNFVEVMAPIFNRASLQVCLNTFSESRSGWGLDWVWGHLLEAEEHRVAIIDAAPVKHTRPVAVGGDLYKNNPEMDPRRDLENLLDRYGLVEKAALGKYAPDLGGVVFREPDKLVNFRRLIRRKNAIRRISR